MTTRPRDGTGTPPSAAATGFAIEQPDGTGLREAVVRPTAQT